jgi:putative ABC transport system substrate-binding protein
MIRRREFVAGLGGAAAWPLAARAQQGGRMRRIGVLMNLASDDPESVARIATGRNVRLDFRRYGDDTNRIPALAQELVGLQPDIILTNATPPTVAVQRETRTIPIVFAGVLDPVASGIVAQLDRPSGNVTGFALFEPSLGGKWFELLSEIAPGLNRAAIMFSPDITPVSIYMPSLEMAARLLKVEPIIAPVRNDVEIETAINPLGREPRGGLLIRPDIFTFGHRAPIILAAARNNVPTVYGISEFVKDGGLLS